MALTPISGDAGHGKAVVCYQAGGYFHCDFLHQDLLVLDSNLQTKFGNLGASIEIDAFDESLAILCQALEENQNKVSCQVIRLKLPPNAFCAYHGFPNMTCEEATCNVDGSWSPDRTATCGRYCPLGDLPGPLPATDYQMPHRRRAMSKGKTFTTSCENVIGNELDVSLAPAQGNIAIAAFDAAGAVICYSKRVVAPAETVCYGLTKSGYVTLQLAKGATVATLSGPTANLCLEKLSATAGFACYSDVANGRRGTCKAISLENGEAGVSQALVATFTSTNVEADRVSIAAFSTAHGVVCYSIPAQNKGQCRVLGYSDLTTPLSVADAGLVEFSADAAPDAITVTTFRDIKAVVCWMDGPELKVFCKILVRAGVSLTAPVPAIMVSTNEYASYFSVVALSPTNAVFCRREGGMEVKCSLLMLTDATNKLIANYSVAAQQAASTFISTGKQAPDANTAAMCAQTGTGAKCAVLRYRPNAKKHKLEANFAGPISSSGTSRYTTIRYFDAEHALVCYERGENRHAACRAFSLNLGNGGRCQYSDANTCGRTTCINGHWTAVFQSGFNTNCPSASELQFRLIGEAWWDWPHDYTALETIVLVCLIVICVFIELIVASIKTSTERAGKGVRKAFAPTEAASQTYYDSEEDSELEQPVGCEPIGAQSIYMCIFYRFTAECMLLGWLSFGVWLCTRLNFFQDIVELFVSPKFEAGDFQKVVEDTYMHLFFAMLCMFMGMASTCSACIDFQLQLRVCHLKRVEVETNKQDVRIERYGDIDGDLRERFTRMRDYFIRVTHRDTPQVGKNFDFSRYVALNLDHILEDLTEFSVYSWIVCMLLMTASLGLALGLAKVWVLTLTNAD